MVLFHLMNIFLAPSRSLSIDNVWLSDCPSVTLFDSPTVFVKWLLGDQLFVDILYIFVNGTSRAIFWALSEINKLIRDPPRAGNVPHFMTNLFVYKCICQTFVI